MAKKKYTIENPDSFVFEIIETDKHGTHAIGTLYDYNHAKMFVKGLKDLDDES